MNTLGKSVLYLYSQPVQVGKRWMQNRQLVTWLESQYNVKKAFCICPDDSPLIQIDGLSNQLVAQSQFEANPPDILFIEYGLGFDYDEGRDTLISAKVDVKMLERYFNNGGITILDIGSRFLNSRKYNQQVKLVLNQARLPSIRLTRSINDYPSPFGISLETAADNVIYAIDPQSNVGEDIDILVLITPDYVSKIADPSLRNIYNGVKKISFCMPLVLDGVNNTPLLIGNQTTQLLAADVFVDCTIPVFAALNDKGNGYSVTISGLCFSDHYFNTEVSDILIFLSNLLSELLTRREEKRALIGQINYVNKSFSSEMLIEIHDSTIRSEIERAQAKLTEDEVDIGLFLFARLFEDSLKSYLLTVEQTLEMNIKPENYTSLNNMITWISKNQIITDSSTLNLLRVERNNKAHKTPTAYERAAMLKSAHLFSLLYIQYIELFVKLRDELRLKHTI